MNQNINIKVMKKPELTDEEIRSHMQFDKLLGSYNANGIVRSSGKKWLYVAAFVTTAVVLISYVLYFLLPESKPNDNKAQPFRTHTTDSSFQIKSHEIVQSRPTIETAKMKATSIQSNVTTKRKDALQFDSVKKTIPSQLTEAEPIEGYSALYEYFSRELKYPIEAARDSIEGIVTVSFVIDQDGKTGLVKIENSLGAAFDKECHRIINSMPLWRPAMINGKPISTRLSIPLTFKINNKD